MRPLSAMALGLSMAAAIQLPSRILDRPAPKHHNSKPPAAKPAKKKARKAQAAGRRNNRRK